MLKSRAIMLRYGCALAVFSACGGHHHESKDYRLYLQDNASDEVLLTLLDAEAQGAVTVDATRAARLTMPTEGAMLRGDTAPTFAWTFPPVAKTPRHGVSSGRFVWLELDGPGLAQQVHLLSIGSMSWSPEGGNWQDIVRDAPGGTVTLTITTSHVDGGVISEGPWRSSAATSVVLAP